MASKTHLKHDIVVPRVQRYTETPQQHVCTQLPEDHLDALFIFRQVADDVECLFLDRVVGIFEEPNLAS